MDVITPALHIVGGLFGGNVVGQAARPLSLGTLLNTLIGALGGGIAGQLGSWLLPGGGQITPAMGATVVRGWDLAAILAHFGIGAVGGGLVLAAIGAIAARRAP